MLLAEIAESLVLIAVHLGPISAPLAPITVLLAEITESLVLIAVLLAEITVPLAPITVLLAEIAVLMGPISAPLAPITVSKAQHSSKGARIGLHPSLVSQLLCVLSKGIEKPCLLVNDAQAELLPGLG